MTSRRQLFAMGTRPSLVALVLFVALATIYLLFGYTDFAKVPVYDHVVSRFPLAQFASFSPEMVRDATIGLNKTSPEQTQQLSGSPSLPLPESRADSRYEDDGYSSSTSLEESSSVSQSSEASGNEITSSDGEFPDHGNASREGSGNSTRASTNGTAPSNITSLSTVGITGDQFSVERKSAILKIQEERRKLVAEVCQENKEELGGDNFFKDTYRHTYVVDDEKLLFCYIPKVGCSNWKRILMVLARKRDVTDEITSREAHARNGLTRLGRLSKEAREYRLKNYRKVMFVRDPLSRVASAYKNKYADLGVYRTAPRVFHYFGKRIIRKYRDNPSSLALATGENVTWVEFVKYLTDKSERPHFDRHWKEMYKLCSPCQIQYDFIGKLENVAEEAEFVLRNFNFTRDVKFPGRENSHPTNITSGTAKYFEDFSTETLNALWEIYHMDYRLFGYDKPQYIGN
ncbi:carbohydrate sulfotransferase 11-like [Diadema antillarum]|uniref:carbohydrate sulfotransferase 11-like n=1 Tax=Diadema antillarum TaxID=105358 RepID=UPI003A8419C1